MGNPKKDKRFRRVRPQYKSTGIKELYVEIMHEDKLIWVKVGSYGGARDTVTGMIVDNMESTNMLLGREITFNANEIMRAKELDYIAGVKQ